MITIKALINQIKWDKRKNPDDFCLYYLDRIARVLVKLEFGKILKIEDNFMSLKSEGKIIQVPLHRIKKVEENGRIIWSRLGEK